eukprot:COSAG01_NODE_40335_length_465_cov_0.688525_2_plen_133_part_01
MALCDTVADDGLTWSAPAPLNVTNTLGPHYAGNGLNHGIEIRRGKFAGRLAMARRYDCKYATRGLNYARSYVLYSDTQGASWTAGELLPAGWTECQVAELSNGSLLLTSRMFGAPYLSNPPSSSDLRRGFARS